MRPKARVKHKFPMKQHNNGRWIECTDNQFAYSQPNQSRGYWHKVRLNIPQVSYTAKNISAIKQFILQYMADDHTSVDKLLIAFKYVANKSVQRGWGGERFTDNGQFTLYLLEPTNPEKLRDFITAIQAFLTDKLHLDPAPPMNTDYAVCGTTNVSMRLERVHGQYCSSISIHDDPHVRDAYYCLMRDTQRYASFATHATTTPFREEEFDDTHHMLCRGYQKVSTLKPASMLVGNAYQQLALIKRKILQLRDQLGDEATAKITELLARNRTAIIRAVEAIKVQSALQIRPARDDAFHKMLEQDSDFQQIIESVYEKPAKEALTEQLLKDDRLYTPDTNELSDNTYMHLILDRLYINCSYRHHMDTHIDYRIVNRDVLTILNAIRSGNDDLKEHIAAIAGQPEVGYVISRLTDPTAKAYLNCLQYRAIRTREQTESGSDHHKSLFNFFQSTAFRAPTKLSAVNKFIDRFEKPGESESLTADEAEAITTKRLQTLVTTFDLTNPTASCYPHPSAAAGEFKAPI